MKKGNAGSGDFEPLINANLPQKNAWNANFQDLTGGNPDTCRADSSRRSHTKADH